MFEDLGFETLTAPQAAIWFGLILGVAFGVLAQRTRFCFRRAIVPANDRRQAAGVWALALASALIGTQAAVAQGWISFDDHRFLAADLPALSIVVGGLMFGAGMVLTRGCISRLTVLSASGNLRAALCVLIFAVVAHATLKGALAPMAAAIRSQTVALGDAAQLSALPGGALFWTAVLALPAVAIALRSGAGLAALLGAVMIGLLVPVGWVGTGWVLYDDFDPIAMNSLSFTLPHAEALFWTVAGTAVPLTFGAGLVGGTLAGAFAAASVTGGLKLQSFETPGQTLRYIAGSALMGTGGVLAGGCTVGAGLAGVPSLGVAALLAIVMIGLGGWVTSRLLGARMGESNNGLVPAE